MIKPAALASPQVLAGVVAIAIGLVDHWIGNNGFGLGWDQALVLGGVGYLVGVGVPSPHE